MKIGAEASDDTARLNWIEENCADVEMLCGGTWRVSACCDYEADTLRGALDDAMAGREAQNAS